MTTLLIEILTEELPPKALSTLSQAFAASIQHHLAQQGFLMAESQLHPYATPRRLAVTLTQVRAHTFARTKCLKVLPVVLALDQNGIATPLLQKKLAQLAASMQNPQLLTQGIALLERAPDGKTESFFYRYSDLGIALADGVHNALEKTLKQLPVPKMMHYQRQNVDWQFVRPAQRLITLYGKQILPVNVLGLQASNITLGHRFLSTQPIEITEADHYADLLDKAYVIADYAQRKERICTQLQSAAQNQCVVIPPALLDEVTALVEWPTVYSADFERSFLDLPKECLILSMQTHQRYFALTNKQGALENRFLIVSNIETSDPRAIIEGNQRVIRARLADAQFFFNNDCKRPLAQRVPDLAQIIYHQQLGSQLQRTERLQKIITMIASVLQLESNIDAQEFGLLHCNQASQQDHVYGNTQRSLAQRAAFLCKADLSTAMVGEFPELQGIMGAIYARIAGESEVVAQAIHTHYQPRFAGDAVPESHLGCALALADKYEILVGIWALGLQPTGEKDPFALRRHALGILRILIEKKIPLDIIVCLNHTCRCFSQTGYTIQNKTLVHDLHLFLLERLRHLLKEQKRFEVSIIESVLALKPTLLYNLEKILEVLQQFIQHPQAHSFALANKRIAQLLKKTADVNTPQTNLSGLPNPKQFQQQQEQVLYQALETLLPQLNQYKKQGDYAAVLNTLLALTQPIECFFDQVMVMTEDLDIRNNRLALLHKVQQKINCFADISLLFS